MLMERACARCQLVSQLKGTEGPLVGSKTQRVEVCSIEREGEAT